MHPKVDFFSDLPDTPRAVEALLKSSDSISLENPDSDSASNYSDSEADEEDVLVMEMEPSPRPLSLASSKKLSELCDYVSDDEACPSLSLPLSVLCSLFFSKPSQIVTLDDDGLDNMLDTLCAPTREPKRDKQLLPVTLDFRNQDALFSVKTWAGQSNLRTGIRFGIAEITNGRDYMEDRTTAKASIEEEAKRQKDKALSGVASSTSFHTDVCPISSSLSPSFLHLHLQYLSKGRTEDFGFFGVYDGHEGSYVSEYLQQHLHIRFRQRLAVNGSLGDGIKTSFLEATSLIDEEILRADYERMKQAKEARVSMTTTTPISADLPPAPQRNTGGAHLPGAPPLPPTLRSEKVPLSPCFLAHSGQSARQTSSPKEASSSRRPTSLMKEAGPQSFAGEGHPPPHSLLDLSLSSSPSS
jgi:hypothetical protein